MGHTVPAQHQNNTPPPLPLLLQRDKQYLHNIRRSDLNFDDHPLASPDTWLPAILRPGHAACSDGRRPGGGRLALGAVKLTGQQLLDFLDHQGAVCGSSGPGPDGADGGSGTGSGPWPGGVDGGTGSGSGAAACGTTPRHLLPGCIGSGAEAPPKLHSGSGGPELGSGSSGAMSHGMARGRCAGSSGDAAAGARWKGGGGAAAVARRAALMVGQGGGLPRVASTCPDVPLSSRHVLASYLPLAAPGGRVVVREVGAEAGGGQAVVRASSEAEAGAEADAQAGGQLHVELSRGQLVDELSGGQLLGELSGGREVSEGRLVGELSGGTVSEARATGRGHGLGLSLSYSGFLTPGHTYR